MAEVPRGYLPPQPTHPTYGYMTPDELEAFEALERERLGLVPEVEDPGVLEPEAAEVPERVVPPMSPWALQVPLPPPVQPPPAQPAPTGVPLGRGEKGVEQPHAAAPEPPPVPWVPSPPPEPWVAPSVPDPDPVPEPAAEPAPVPEPAGEPEREPVPMSPPSVEPEARPLPARAAPAAVPARREGTGQGDFGDFVWDAYGQQWVRQDPEPAGGDSST